MVYLFNVIYADPPWSYDNKNTGGSMVSGAAQQYPTMCEDAIAALPVASVAATNAVLALWVPVPLLPAGLRVMRQWGFKYKTTWPWIKTGRPGLGWWGRVDTEFLLIGVRGKVRPPRLGSVSSTLTAPVSVHSRKPAEMRARLEDAMRRCFGFWHEPKDGLHFVTPVPLSDLSCLELFARAPVPGWTCVGYDVGDGVSVESFLANHYAAYREQALGQRSLFPEH